MEQQQIEIELNDNIIKKLLFLYNALEKGWTIKKNNDLFIFNKKHEGKKKFFDNNYLSTFMKENSDIDILLKELM